VLDVRENEIDVKKAYKQKENTHSDVGDGIEPNKFKDITHQN